MSALPSGGLPGRVAAYRAVLNVLTRQTFVSETLGLLREREGLDGREAGLATEIALGAVRHVYTIDQVLRNVATYDKQNVAPEVRAVLYTAAYQAIWMDRIPLFAVVNEAVNLTHEHAQKRAAGMVNAVLRRLTDAVAERRTRWLPGSARQIRVNWDQACALKVDVLPPADPELDAHLAAATGERAERFAALVERLGFDEASAVAWASQAVPVIVLQRHRLRISPADFRKQVLETCGDGAVVTDDAAFVSAEDHALDTPLFRDGLAYVQDSTAQAAAALVAAQPGQRVLDLCAAPGGKSVALAQQMEDRGEVVACDVEASRLVQVSANADRLGLQCVRTTLIDPTAEQLNVEGEFDAAIVDAPCSNTGVIARRPEARLGLTPKKVKSLAALQQTLLRKAASAVRPGGRLVYSTCCLEPEENAQTVEAFLFDHHDWSQIDAKLTTPQWGPTPGEWRDGGFAAVLERRG